MDSILILMIGKQFIICIIQSVSYTKVFIGQPDLIYLYVLVPMNLFIILKSECNEILKTLICQEA
jgi:hypothetical protein